MSDAGDWLAQQLADERARQEAFKPAIEALFEKWWQDTQDGPKPTVIICYPRDLEVAKAILRETSE